MNDYTLDGWRALGCAVLLRAWSDTRNNNGHKAAREAGIPTGITLAQDARSFLHGDGARWLVAALDLDQDGLDHALDGMPRPEFEQLTLPWEV